MSDNPLDPSPEFKKRVETLANELWVADGSPEGRMEEYRERADELARMEMAGATGLNPNPMNQGYLAGHGIVVEEASIQQNLGEFPSGPLGDQGRFLETPMTRKDLLDDEKDLPEGGTSA